MSKITAEVHEPHDIVTSWRVSIGVGVYGQFVYCKNQAEALTLATRINDYEKALELLRECKRYRDSWDSSMMEFAIDFPDLDLFLAAHKEAE